MITTHTVALSGFTDLCQTGELHDAPAMAALTPAQRFLKRQDAGTAAREA